jgi:hypothetical protein
MSVNFGCGTPGLVERACPSSGVPNPVGGRPRVNIQNDRGMGKTYQVRQVLKAIERLERGDAA